MAESFLYLTPALIVGFIFIAIAVYIYNDSKKDKRRQDAFREFASQHNFSYTSNGSLATGGSYAIGRATNIISGTLPVSGNVFKQYYQTEVRGSGQHAQFYYRTVFSVDTPDILSQFVINGKLNNFQNTGGNLESYKGSQKLQLEGNFSDFFDVLVPTGNHQELLMLLAPDVMRYIIDHFAYCDIEVQNKTLYIYIYRHLEPHETFINFELVDELVRKMRLRIVDARNVSEHQKTLVTEAHVSRVATESIERKSLSRSRFDWALRLTAIPVLFPLLFIAACGFAGARNYIGVAVIGVFAATILLCRKLIIKRLTSRHQRSVTENESTSSKHNS